MRALTQEEYDVLTYAKDFEEGDDSTHFELVADRLVMRGLLIRLEAHGEYEWSYLYTELGELAMRVSHPALAVPVG